LHCHAAVVCTKVNAILQLQSLPPTRILDFPVTLHAEYGGESITMIVDQPEASGAAKPLLDMAWAILEAAHELRDGPTVDACRRVIDAIFRGVDPTPSDMSIVQDFFS
jgi:hypothetical protein